MKGVLKNNVSENIVKDYCERVYFLVNLLIQKKQVKLFSKSWKQLQMAASENSFNSEVNPSRNGAVCEVAWKTQPTRHPFKTYGK